MSTITRILRDRLCNSCQIRNTNALDTSLFHFISGQDIQEFLCLMAYQLLKVI